MAVPREYTYASRDFERFLADAKAALDDPPTDCAYRLVRAVFIVFRRRLDPEESLRFAGTLPVVLRALFIAQWEDAPRSLWADRSALLSEVKEIADHHLDPSVHVIEAVAGALSDYVDETAFRHIISTLSPEAQAFWAPPATQARH